MKYFILLLSIVCMSSCFDKNKITLDFRSLNSGDIDIYVSISPEIHEKLIYSKGAYYSIPNEYGENDWIIIYKGQKKCSFRHFKTNRRHSHKYKFVFYEKQDTIYCDIIIHGKNDMERTCIFTTMIDNTK